MSYVGAIRPGTFRRPPEAGLDVRPLISLGICAAVVCLYIFNSNSFAATGFGQRTAGLLFLLAALVMVNRAVLLPSGQIRLDPFEPESFYSIFFGAYYLLPFTAILLDPRMGEVDYVAVGVAILLGFGCFQAGCRWAPRRPPKRIDLPDHAARALLAVCWMCMGLVAVFYYWRLRNGNFYTHAMSYEVGTDVASSLFESFVLQLHIPLVLLCGLALACNVRHARIARLTLNLFLAFSFALFLASSQFRLMVTLMPMAWIGNRMYLQRSIPWQSALKMAGAAVVTLVLIFTIRASGANSGLADSSNQLADLVDGVASGDFFDASVISDATLGSGGAGSRTRAISPLLFFNDVVESLKDPSNSFGMGKSFIHESLEVVPRAFWRSKPVFQSTQLLIRQELGMSQVDNSPHPLLQFYYEFGWPGIAVGFFLMGFGIRWLADRCDSIFFFFILAFAWSAFVQVEVGIYLNLLVVIRAAIILYLAWRVLRFFFFHAQPVSLREPQLRVPPTASGIAR